VVVPVRGADGEADRDPGPIGLETALDALLDAVGGVRSGGLPAERGLGRRPIRGLPGPAETDLLISATFKPFELTFLED
jgi:hypothetical protein